MIYPVLCFAMFSVLSSKCAFVQVSASVDVETLSQIVRNHSNALIEFQSYVDRTKSVEKHIQDFDPNLSVYENFTKSLKESIVELKNISGKFTEKLENFKSYTNKTDKLEGQVINLLETAETYGGTLSSLEIYNRRTAVLEEYVNTIDKDLKLGASERNAISQNLESSRQTYKAQHIIITTELAKINTVQEKHQEITQKLNEIISAVKEEENSTSQNIRSMQENYSAEQSELKSKVQEVDNISQAEEDITNKLTSVVAQFEEQKKNAANNLQSLRSSFTGVQNEIKIQLQKINPLTKTQEEITNKLNNVVASIAEATQLQQTLQKNFKQLSDRIQQFIGSHTSHYY